MSARKLAPIRTTDTYSVVALDPNTLRVDVFDHDERTSAMLDLASAKALFIDIGRAVADAKRMDE